MNRRCRNTMNLAILFAILAISFSGAWQPAKGASATLNFQNVSDYKLYQFYGQAGQTFSFNMTWPDIEAVINMFLFDQSMDLVTSIRCAPYWWVTERNYTLTQVLPASGNYTILLYMGVAIGSGVVEHVLMKCNYALSEIVNPNALGFTFCPLCNCTVINKDNETSKNMKEGNTDQSY